MEQLYDHEFDPDGPEPQSQQHEEIETIGSTTPTTTTPSSENQVSKRKRSDSPSKWKRRSPVWDHYNFKKVFSDTGVFLHFEAWCKYCQKVKYKATSTYGTANAKKHTLVCPDYLASSPIPDFDQKVFCRMFAEAIMYHSYALSIVEHVKLREMLSYLQPKVRHVTRNTILRYCLLEHERLKSFLRECLSELNSRVCFTCDCWSACTSRGFLTLTAHFVDNNWNLKSRILNFRYFPPPHRGVDISLFVVGLIKEWGLETKVFSMNCDNAGAMDVMVRRLKSNLHSFRPLPLNGRFFHVRCCAHILNLIVQSGMNVIDDSVLKVRGAVNYIAGSDSRLCVFDKCVADSQCNFIGKLRIDCPTRWNSTYLMLKRVIEAKEALILFGTIDLSFDYVLTDEEWKIVEYVCNFLEPFDCITKLFSGSDYPTANLYFPYILAIEKLLVLGHNHKVPSIQDMASAMLVKFEKYWSDYSIVLGIAILLDPRYKNVMIRSALGRLYISGEVERRVKEIREAFIELYNFYDTSPSSSLPPRENGKKQSSDGFGVNSLFEVRFFPFDFLFTFKSVLRTDNVEAFVTTQNWLYGYLKEVEMEECFEVMKEVMPDDIDFESLSTP
ncbi:putative AC transposase, partial [Bienertia sinuspersici]